MKPRERRPSLPHPDVVAARERLATRSPAPLSKIHEQIKEAQDWRNRPSSAGGLKRKGA